MDALLIVAIYLLPFPVLAIAAGYGSTENRRAWFVSIADAADGTWSSKGPRPFPAGPSKAAATLV